MTTSDTLGAKIEFLVRRTGRAEAEIVAEAVQTGVNELYRRQVSKAYLAGELTRERAVAELGEAETAELDFACAAVERDVLWGMARG